MISLIIGVWNNDEGFILSRESNLDSVQESADFLAREANMDVPDQMLVIRSENGIPFVKFHFRVNEDYFEMESGLVMENDWMENQLDVSSNRFSKKKR